MGLIREPKNVNFTVIDKTWTAEERNEFSAFIKLRKDQRKKQTKPIVSSERKMQNIGRRKTTVNQ